MENYMEIVGKFTKAPDPMVMVVSVDGTFYFVNKRSKTRKALWHYHSNEPIWSGACSGGIDSIEITGNEEGQIKQQCNEIFGEEPKVRKLGDVYHYLHSKTGEAYDHDGDDLLYIIRTDWEIAFTSFVLRYSHIDVFLPCVDKTIDVSERLKCLVLHARSGEKLIDICCRHNILYLPGDGSLSRVINLRRRIEIHGYYQAPEKIKKTSILNGSFQGHNVIVKKVLKEENNDYSKTLELYRECHDLDGVVKLEIDESDEDYRYLAFEECCGNLVQVFLSAEVGQFFEEEAARIKIMRQLVLAVQELHKKAFLHRNLNPYNVLIQKSNQSLFGFKVKLCGLGNCRVFKKPTDYEEMYQSELRDMAQTLVYIMTAGKYVFKYNRPGHYEELEELKTQGYSLPKRKEKIEYKGTLRQEFKQCIETLMRQKSIPLDVVLRFPFFWSADEKMTLIRDVADQLLDIDKDLLEENSEKIFGRYGWGATIKKDWFESMKKIKKKGSQSSDEFEEHYYDGTSMRDLVRLTRNSVNHPGKIAPGTDTIKLEAYLSEKWPHFFITVYWYALSVCTPSFAMHAKYFGPGLT